MIRTADVFAGIKSLWNASTLTLRVPGGLWEGRPQQAAADPYAVLKVTEGAKERLSTGYCLYTFTVAIDVYSAAGATAAAVIQRDMQTVISYARKTALVVTGADNVVDIRPPTGKAEADPATLDSKDVKLTGCAWDIVLHGLL